MHAFQTELFARNKHAYDLHTHSTASDGTLTPIELIEAAIDCGVSHLAISDHDTLDGYKIAKNYLDINKRPLNLIPAVEFSSRWCTRTSDDGSGMTVHIVALNLVPENPDLKALIDTTQTARHTRNQRIQEKMHKKGWSDVFDLALELTQGGQLTRTHLAKAMVQLDKVPVYYQAFSKYLGSGKPLAVHTKWPTLTETITQIHKAGGSAVLAHPLHYQLTRSKLLQLCSDFRQAGGDAIEVITGRANKRSIEDLTGIALRLKLRASIGSDFHAPVKGNYHLGIEQTLPKALSPVWETW
jgi:predicted metal-dependent phosphoesterase TrpH